MIANHILQDVRLHGGAVILGVLQARSLHNITRQAILLKPDAAVQLSVNVQALHASRPFTLTDEVHCGSHFMEAQSLQMFCAQ